MNDKDVKKITNVFDEKFKLLLGELARVRSEISGSKATQFRQYTELSRIGKDIARIDSVLESLSEESKGHTKKLKKIDAVWDQVVEITLGLEDIKEKMDFQAETSSKSNDNVEKLDKRVTTVESHLGISVLPELAIIR